LKKQHYIFEREQSMKVIIGAGQTNYDGWISTQEIELNVMDESSFNNLFEVDSIDTLLAEHVWEHMTFEDGIVAAKNCFKYLKPGGYLRCAVPDANFDNEYYQNMVQIGGPGPKDHPAYSHKIVYDYKKLVSVFEAAGFTVDLLEYCDEHSKFHSKYWNPEDGFIGRSYQFDTRNSNEQLGMVSIIIDARKVSVID
jgi:predicted SAM-dependent methyltransferase